MGLSLHDLLRSRVHAATGYVLAFAGRSAAAIANYRSAVRHDPGYVKAWRNLGFLLATSNSDEALRALREAVDLDPAHAATRFNLGFILHGLARFDEAIAEFETVVAGAPNHDRAWFGLGLCRKELGRLEEAAAALREASKLQYFNPHAAYELAVVYQRLGDHEKLKAEYERVKGFDPSYAERIRVDTGVA